MSFQAILNIAIPAITLFLMTLVGMDITTKDFQNVRDNQKSFWVGLLGQYLLPFCVLLIMFLLKPDSSVSDGMMLVASAPAGGISSYYAYMARVNVALSISITSVSTFFAAFTMPVLLHFFYSLSSEVDRTIVPVGILFQKLFLLLVLPVGIGFFVRSRSPEFVLQYSKGMRRTGFFALGCLILFIFYQTWNLFLESWLQIVQAAAAFVAVSMLLGYLVSILFRLNTRDAFTLSIEFGTRNIAICTAISVIVLHRPEFATFGAIYFLVEAAIILPLIETFRRFVVLRGAV